MSAGAGGQRGVMGQPGFGAGIGQPGYGGGYGTNNGMTFSADNFGAAPPGTGGYDPRPPGLGGPPPPAGQYGSLQGGYPLQTEPGMGPTRQPPIRPGQPGGVVPPGMEAAAAAGVWSPSQMGVGTDEPWRFGPDGRAQGRGLINVNGQWVPKATVYGSPVHAAGNPNQFGSGRGPVAMGGWQNFLQSKYGQLGPLASQFASGAGANDRPHEPWTADPSRTFNYPR